MTALEKTKAPARPRQGLAIVNETISQKQYIKPVVPTQAVLHLVPQVPANELPALTASNPAHPAHWLIETAVNCRGATFEVWQGSAQHIGEISIAWDSLSIGAWRFDVRTYPSRGDNRHYPSHYVKRYQAVGIAAGLLLLARAFTVDELADAVDAFLDDLHMEPLDPPLKLETQRVTPPAAIYIAEDEMPVNHAKKPKAQTYEQRIAARYSRKASRVGDDWLHLAELGVL